jgi:hypothetical protein
VSRCGSCNRPVGPDAESAAYVRTNGDAVLAVRSYPLCSRCLHMAETCPKRLERALRRTYERDALN